MHSHNLSAHLWYESYQLKGKYSLKFQKEFQNEVVLLYSNKIEVFCNCLEQQLSQKEQRNHHRLVPLAGRPNAKSRTVDHILFEKESDFCTTFGLAHGWPTLRWLANLLEIQAVYITISLQDHHNNTIIHSS